MNYIIDGFIFILTAYIAFTNGLAHFIEDIIPSQLQQKQEEIVQLPSFFQQSIPDVLLRSGEYQSATVGAASGLSGSTTQNPLEAIVNIFCTFRTPQYIRTTTGTGFFIDPDGIIMTNAHIAQFLLVAKTSSFGSAECTIRDGSPASPRYTADLLYIPPTWIQQNASVIHESAPMGTGERDYALLYVNDTIDGTPLPARFPALAFNDDLMPVSTKNTQVVAAGYPARELFRSGSSADLLARSATTSISELYTFGSNFADVFSVRGTIVGAQGSSGGPIVNSDGEVIGVIVTRGDDDIDGEGSLRAITLSHITRTIKEETGFTLRENLNGNLSVRADIFARTMTPFLIQMLEGAEQN